MDKGITLGIFYPLFIKGWLIISSKVNLLVGSNYKMAVIRFLDYSEIKTWSGKEY